MDGSDGTSVDGEDEGGGQASPDAAAADAATGASPLAGFFAPECVAVVGATEREGSVGRAEEPGVPVLLVQSDTTTAIERLEGVIRSGRARDARTVERMRDLLTEYADVDAMLLGPGD